MYKGRKAIAIIAAAGSGSRMNMDRSKLLLKIEGKTVIEKTLDTFAENAHIDSIIVATSDEDVARICSGKDKLMAIVPGGRERQDSINGALSLIDDENSIVLVQDGARPFTSSDLIDNIIKAAHEVGASIPAVPLKDTIKTVEGNHVGITLERSSLVSVQTPQGFKASLLKKAYENAMEKQLVVTDDSSMVELLGHKVAIVMGEYDNIKITTKEDLRYLGGNEMDIRTGVGYDVHKLVEGRDLILGGVKIPHTLGLLGHSDADVLLHAVMDSILGAIGQGDIGRHFPDTDDSYKGISSIKLLEHVKKVLDESGYTISNLDCLIIAQKPKVLPYAMQMRKNIASVLEIMEDRVNVKATTTEKLGFEGREEGISSMVSCLVVKNA